MWVSLHVVWIGKLRPCVGPQTLIPGSALSHRLESPSAGTSVTLSRLQKVLSRWKVELCLNYLGHWEVFVKCCGLIRSLSLKTAESSGPPSGAFYITASMTSAPAHLLLLCVDGL